MFATMLLQDLIAFFINMLIFSKMNDSWARLHKETNSYLPLGKRKKFCKDENVRVFLSAQSNSL